jgi:hypothetical protein
MVYRGWALLPTGKYLNPSNPDGEYWDPQCSIIICSRYGASKPVALTTYGSPPTSVGQKAFGFHDQSGGQILEGQVIGIRRPDGTTDGEVPNARLPHWVFK